MYSDNCQDTRSGSEQPKPKDIFFIQIGQFAHTKAPLLSCILADKETTGVLEFKAPLQPMQEGFLCLQTIKLKRSFLNQFLT